jgi:predicted double-glycine peptidase
VEISVVWQGLLGAGGNWYVLDEQLDPTVTKQFNQDACGAACGQMLLRDRGVEDVTQQAIAQISGGVPMRMQELAVALNQLWNLPGEWVGQGVQIPGTEDQALLQILCRTGSWGAGLWEEEAIMGHIVVVDRVGDEQVWIRDPWGLEWRSRVGTRYKMGVSEFLSVWTRQAVFLR